MLKKRLNNIQQQLNLENIEMLWQQIRNGAQFDVHIFTISSGNKSIHNVLPFSWIIKVVKTI